MPRIAVALALIWSIGNAASLSAPAHAQTFAANDVSILLQAPLTESDPTLLVPEGLISTALARVAGTVIEGINAPEKGVKEIDISLLSERRDHWRVASIRIDPGAPGMSEAFTPFGRNLQIRLVVQPVNFAGGGQPVRDEAIHLVYTFGALTGPNATGCPLRVLPNSEDIADFQAAVSRLADIKKVLANEGVTTGGVPLGVHPAFGHPETAELLVEQLANFLNNHVSEARLSALSVAGLPPEAPEPWIFVALRRTSDGGFEPFPAPSVDQSGVTLVDQSGATKKPAFRQMLSFVPSAGHSEGAVIPPGLNRNLMPVDCMTNFILASANLPQPDASQGVSTSSLFGAGANNPEEAARIGAIIADVSASHFFNTDCVSCHTETRREIDAEGESDDVLARIAEASGIATEAMPIAPNQGDSGDWNVRAFGWFPGFPPSNARAHATVVRRTAFETHEVVECLNEGDWTAVDSPCVAHEDATFLDQGWSDGIRRAFYHTSQGGDIMPLAWFLALERPDSQERFAAPASMARYGALRSPRDDANPFGLPVGFAVTGEGAEALVGLNCAACHSADVIAGGERLRLDGAPAAFDLDRFAIDLASSVRDTAVLDLSDRGNPRPSEKLRRMMVRISLADPTALDSPAKQALFIRKFLAFSAGFDGRMALRHPALPSGPGRVDALTQIVNTVAAKDLGVPTNLVNPRAPTSYPSLWLVEQLERVQWNMAAADPLSRNLGQALGVFGKIDFSKENLFGSSADIRALELYESWITDLQTPDWPEALLGDIDTDLAVQGRDLFAAQCLGCHNAPPYELTAAEDNADDDVFVAITPVHIDKVDTDRAYTNAFTRRFVQTGKIAALFPDKDTGKHRPVVSGLEFLSTVVGSATRKARVETPGGSKPRMRPVGHSECLATGNADRPCGYFPPSAGAALKAGPLAGIWATGPYLHNGSVRTVYEVISAPEDRAETFFIGDRTLDSDRMGFANTKTEKAFLFDTRLAGNGNGGHDFWSERPLTHEQKMAIIEYLKDPEAFPIER